MIIRSEKWNVQSVLADEAKKSHLRLWCPHHMVFEDGSSSDETHLVVYIKNRHSEDSGSYGKYQNHGYKDQQSGRTNQWITLTFFCPEDQFYELKADIRSGLSLMQVEFEVWDPEGNPRASLHRDFEFKNLRVFFESTSPQARPLAVFVSKIRSWFNF